MTIKSRKVDKYSGRIKKRKRQRHGGLTAMKNRTGEEAGADPELKYGWGVKLLRIKKTLNLT